MIIDAHGHYTTVPGGLRVFRALQISQMGKPAKAAVNISDDEIRASLEKGQLKLLDERGIDVMLFSPMASATCVRSICASSPTRFRCTNPLSAVSPPANTSPRRAACSS